MWNVSSIVLSWESTPPIPAASVNVEDFIVQMVTLSFEISHDKKKPDLV